MYQCLSKSAFSKSESLINSVESPDPVLINPPLIPIVSSIKIVYQQHHLPIVLKIKLLKLVRSVSSASWWHPRHAEVHTPIVLVVLFYRIFYLQKCVKYCSKSHLNEDQPVSVSLIKNFCIFFICDEVKRIKLQLYLPSVLIFPKKFIDSFQYNLFCKMKYTNIRF